MQKINLVMINRFHGQVAWTFEDMMSALLHLLNAAGYDARITANHLDPHAINILFGVGSMFSHSYEEIAQFSPAHSTIIFNCEQIDSDSALITDDYLNFLSRYVLFDWCQPNIEAIRRKIALRHPLFEMPLFPTPNLSASSATAWNIDYDLGFYGALPTRRKKLLAELEQAGVSVKHIFGHFGQALADHLLDCRYVLNMHAYETDLLESNRCLRPMAMGIPLISEVSSMPASGDWDDCGIIFVPTDGFGAAVKRIVADPDRHLVAARKAVQFTHRPANALKVKDVMDRAIAALAQLAPAS
jgi:hypothetical protein